MYMIKWRNRSEIRIVSGLSRYQSKGDAQSQVDKWQKHFPQNTYYVESI